jgi:hypothetical protein
MQVHMSIVGRLMPCVMLQVDSTNKARWFSQTTHVFFFLSAHQWRTNHSRITVRYTSDIKAHFGRFSALLFPSTNLSKNALSWGEIDKDRNYL